MSEKGRIRHKTTLNLIDAFNRLWVDQEIQFQCRSLSDPPLSEIELKYKMAWVWKPLFWCLILYNIGYIQMIVDNRWQNWCQNVWQSSWQNMRLFSWRKFEKLVAKLTSFDLWYRHLLQILARSSCPLILTCKIYSRAVCRFFANGPGWRLQCKQIKQ